MLNNLAVLPNIPIRIHRKMLGFRVLVRNFHDICPYNLGQDRMQHHCGLIGAGDRGMSRDPGWRGRYRTRRVPFLQRLPQGQRRLRRKDYLPSAGKDYRPSAKRYCAGGSQAVKKHPANV